MYKKLLSTIIACCFLCSLVRAAENSYNQEINTLKDDSCFLSLDVGEMTSGNLVSNGNLLKIALPKRYIKGLVPSPDPLKAGNTLLMQINFDNFSPYKELNDSKMTNYLSFLINDYRSLEEILQMSAEFSSGMTEGTRFTESPALADLFKVNYVPVYGGEIFIARAGNKVTDVIDCDDDNEQSLHVLTCDHYTVWQGISFELTYAKENLSLWRKTRESARQFLNCIIKR